MNQSAADVCFPPFMHSTGRSECLSCKLSWSITACHDIFVFRRDLLSWTHKLISNACM